MTPEAKVLVEGVLEESLDIVKVVAPKAAKIMKVYYDAAKAEGMSDSLAESFALSGIESTQAQTPIKPVEDPR